jgi:hypothetical protein
MCNTKVQLTLAQQLWVDALRSGKFDQAQCTLQEGDGFCCLGVACAVAKGQGVSVVTHEDGTIHGSTLDRQRPVWGWLGLKDPMGYFENPELQVQLQNAKPAVYGDLKLTKLNDIAQFNFTQLADVIEQNAGSLFIQPT